MKKRYVIGLIHNNNEVLLLKKRSPMWQCGFLNGVGGEVGDNESPLDTMIREANLKTNLLLEDRSKWNKLQVSELVRGVQMTITYYSINVGDELNNASQGTDEELIKFKLFEHNDLKPVHGLSRFIKKIKRNIRVHA